MTSKLEELQTILASKLAIIDNKYLEYFAMTSAAEAFHDTIEVLLDDVHSHQMVTDIQFQRENCM